MTLWLNSERIDNLDDVPVGISIADALIYWGDRAGNFIRPLAGIERLYLAVRAA